MARQFSEEVVVRIWRNATGLFGVRSHTGHASLTIRGSLVKKHPAVPKKGTREKGNKFVKDSIYISWRPDILIPIPIYSEVTEVEAETIANYYEEKFEMMGSDTVKKLNLWMQEEEMKIPEKQRKGFRPRLLQKKYSKG